MPHPADNSMSAGFSLKSCGHSHELGIACSCLLKRTLLCLAQFDEGLRNDGDSILFDATFPRHDHLSVDDDGGDEHAVATRAYLFRIMWRKYGTAVLVAQDVFVETGQNKCADFFFR